MWFFQGYRIRVRIPTNRAFLDFYFSKTNPQIESLGIWIHEFGFASPQIWIFKDLFCGIVLKIRED